MRGPTTPDAAGELDVRELLDKVVPLHVACIGEWRGVYTELDSDNKVVERYDSQMKCSLPEGDSEHDYHQTNRYSHADGRVEEYFLPARCIDGRM